MFIASLWKRVPGQCLMATQLKPRLMTAKSLIDLILGLVKKKHSLQAKLIH
jgi:hypothetical protein